MQNLGNVSQFDILMNIFLMNIKSNIRFLDTTIVIYIYREMIEICHKKIANKILYMNL